MRRRCPGSCASSPLFRIDFNAERPWKRPYVKGYGWRDLRSAAKALVEATPDDIETMLDTFPGHLEARKQHSTLGEYCDAFALQVYSSDDFNGRPIPLEGAPESPGEWQRTELLEWIEDWRKSASVEPVPAKLIAGLAAYDQTWDRTVDAMIPMGRSYSAAAALADECWWWSAKHSVGVRRNSYAARVISTLTGRQNLEPDELLRQAADLADRSRLAVGQVEVALEELQDVLERLENRPSS